MSRREYEAEDRRVHPAALAAALVCSYLGWFMVCGAVAHTLGDDVGLVLAAMPLIAGSVTTMVHAAMRGVK